MKFNAKQIPFPILLFCAIAIFTILSACKKNMDEKMPALIISTPTVPSIPAGPSKTFLALGDSYTIGQSVEAGERFPAQTAALLGGYGISVNVPVYVATTGWTTGNLLDALNSNPPAGTFDIVTLLIGVNNQYQGRSIEEYRAQFTTLLNIAIKYAGNNRKHVFVLSIPDYSVTPFAAGSDRSRIAAEIDEFNAACKELTLAQDVQFVDITPISREGSHDPAMQADDGLHPSGKQYGRWSGLLAPLIKTSL